jgi:hypothetical protein
MFGQQCVKRIAAVLVQPTCSGRGQWQDEKLQPQIFKAEKLLAKAGRKNSNTHDKAMLCM